MHIAFIIYQTPEQKATVRSEFTQCKSHLTKKERTQNMENPRLHLVAVTFGVRQLYLGEFINIGAKRKQVGGTLNPSDS